MVREAALVEIHIKPKATKTDSFGHASWSLHSAGQLQPEDSLHGRTGMP